MARLRVAGCVAAEAEADELIAAAVDGTALDASVRRRERGEPLAWITGSATFAGPRLVVRPGVYVPRPQTEALARRAVARLPPTGCAVDLCTGSGAIAAHLLATRPGARVVGLDRDATAVRCARANGVAAVRADLRQVPLAPGCADVVTAVAPYVPTAALSLLPSDVRDWEPHAALDGGPDGLDLTRAVVETAAELLRPGGVLLVEVGGDQAARLGPTLAGAGFGEIVTWTDDEGDLRGLATERQRSAVTSRARPPRRRP